MHRILSAKIADRAAGGRRVLLWLFAALTAPGCQHEPEIEFLTAIKPEAVRLIEPQLRNFVREVGQPSFIESYERTSIYNKPTAYIDKWTVDIGDKVKKGNVLAKLFAPERDEELKTKKADVVLARERIALAKEMVEVAKAEVTAAEAAPERGRRNPGQVRGRG